MLNNQGYSSHSYYIQQIIRFSSVVRKLGRERSINLFIHFKHPHWSKHWATVWTNEGQK